MSNSIEVAVHCFADQLPQYAAMLRFQASRLAAHCPGNAAVFHSIAVASAANDRTTWSVIPDIVRLASKTYQPRIVTLPKELLFRRSIFRHRISQESRADVIWYADCDYLIGEGAIEAILAQVQKTDGLRFPREYWRHLDHDRGDETWQKMASQAVLPPIDPSQFELIPSKFAIGGIQLIGADEAKRIGYLGGRRSKWQRPVNPDIPFADFRDDSTWRRKLPRGYGRSIDVPNLFRVRHSHGAKGSPGPKDRLPESVAS